MKTLSRPGYVRAVVLLSAMLVPVVAIGVEVSETPAAARKAGQSREELVPADVLARVCLFGDELELLRFEMGNPISLQPALGGSRAAPRAVYFQAFTMFRKANRLVRDLTASNGKEPRTPPVDRIQPDDAWAVSDAALARLLVARQRLGILKARTERPIPVETTPTDIYRSIVQANRRFKLPREGQVFYSGRRFASHVFQQAGIPRARLLELRIHVKDRPDWLKSPVELSQGVTS